MPPRQDILSPFDYTDFRLYLRDFYQFRKQGERGYSYRSFSRAAGFKAPNVLKLVIDGKRNIGAEALPKFVTALGLEGTMAEYFVALVRMNQAKCDEEREDLLRAMTALLPVAKRRNLNPEVFEYLSHWIYPVMREMTTLPAFREDPYWIARRLQNGCKLEEVTRALAFLKEQGFVISEPEGLRPCDNMVMSSDEVRSLAVRNYHRQMLGQAQHSLEHAALSVREFGALTFALPETAIEELKHKLKRFRSDLHKWAVEVAETAENDVVMQVNFQMYPHTQAERGK